MNNHTRLFELVAMAMHRGFNDAVGSGHDLPWSSFPEDDKQTWITHAQNWVATTPDASEIIARLSYRLAAVDALVISAVDGAEEKAPYDAKDAASKRISIAKLLRRLGLLLGLGLLLTSACNPGGCTDDDATDPCESRGAYASG